MARILTGMSRLILEAKPRGPCASVRGLSSVLLPYVGFSRARVPRPRIVWLWHWKDLWRIPNHHIELSDRAPDQVKCLVGTHFYLAAVYARRRCSKRRSRNTVDCWIRRSHITGKHESTRTRDLKDRGFEWNDNR